MSERTLTTRNNQPCSPGLRPKTLVTGTRVRRLYAALSADAQRTNRGDPR